MHTSVQPSFIISERHCHPYIPIALAAGTHCLTLVDDAGNMVTEMFTVEEAEK